ncbi:hypothetical protein Clacol_003206 [Clathrus columnatus]|uniref:Chromo domain-containing protein n=1 Tax=Clathrus columnatus TaxID=1419009 RepID=A0AAV5A400_9AGAM|nr:hypothetical protein Clacol_003206 [Clathrus columnatus]
MLSPSENKPILTSLPNENIELKPKNVKKNKLDRVINISNRTLTINVDALDTLFYVMAERHRIYRKRNAGLPPPWTDDPVLAENRFCNVYRILDRGTQYVIEQVINKGPQDHTETCFRVMLYKLFNRIATWEYLVEELGTPTWETFNMDRYGEVLKTRLLTSPIYTSAYQIPAPNLGHAKGYMNHLYLLQVMMEDDVPELLLHKNSLKEAYKLISDYPGMGPFLSIQLLLDLNMTSQLNFSEREWVTCGPGSRSYLRTLFGTAVAGVETEAIAYLYNTQDEHFNRLGIFDPPSLPDSPGVSHVDLEHALCECHKYIRMKKHLSTGRRLKRAEFKAEVKNEEEMKIDIKDEMKVDMEEEIKLEMKEKTRTLKTRNRNVAIQATSKKIVMTDSPISIFNDIDVIDLTNEDNDDDDIIDLCQSSDDDDTDYEVSHIVADRRTRDGGWEYKIRWVGYGPKDDTWLPEKELRSAPLILREWRAIRRSGGPGKAGI